jgi:hypothetical protein
MKRNVVIGLGTAIALAAFAPLDANAQHHERTAQATGGATSRSGGDGGSRSGGGQSSSGGGQSSGAPARPSGGDSGQAGPRAVPRSEPSGGGRADGGQQPRARSGDSSAGAPGTSVPTYSRAREDRNSRGEAVERRPGSRGGSTIIVGGPSYYGGGFYPWGYGGLGLGGYYGALYDPWWYDSSFYAPTYAYNNYGYDGALRLKVKPRDASVYVDGYFAGRVDDFDGVFQKLRLEPGPHRVELRQDGFEPLLFEVRIQPDKTLTYTGELKQTP